jgi:hypothetical protein
MRQCSIRGIAHGRAAAHSDGLHAVKYGNRQVNPALHTTATTQARLSARYRSPDTMKFGVCTARHRRRAPAGLAVLGKRR